MYGEQENIKHICIRDMLQVRSKIVHNNLPLI